MSDNVRDIRSFSVAERKKNLGEGRAEPRTVYPLLCVPNETKWSESAAWSERSGEVGFSLLYSKFLGCLQKIIYETSFSSLEYFSAKMELPLRKSFQILYCYIQGNSSSNYF